MPQRGQTTLEITEPAKGAAVVATAELLRGPFGRVLVANFSFFLNFASFFLLPLFVKNLGGSETTVGWVMGAGGFATLLALPLVAVWIDRSGARLVFVCGALVMTAVTLLYTKVAQLGALLLVLRLLQGTAFAAAFTAATTLAAHFAPASRRAQALGWFGVSTLLTHALAPIAGEEVIHRFGFRTLFVLAAACSTLAAVCMVGMTENTAKLALPRRTVHQLPSMHYLLAAVMVFSGMGFGCVTTYAPTFIQMQQLGRVGAFFAAYTASAIVVRIFAASLSDRWGRVVIILPALGTLGVAILALAFVRQSFTLVVAGSLFGLAQGLAYPSLHALLVDTAPPAALGRAQALFNGSFNLGVMSSAFLFGVISDAWGQSAMFAIAALTPWAAAAIVLFAVKSWSRAKVQN